MNHLDSIGLIKFSALAGFRMKGLDEHTVFPYFGRHVELTLLQEARTALDTGHVILTQIGKELAPM